MTPKPPFRGKFIRRERLPRRKQMTIAIGLFGQDCIVMAADTQESTGNYMKSDETKLLPFISFGSGAVQADTLQPGACVVAGAGDSGYVRALSIKLGQKFLDNPKVRLSSTPQGEHIELLVEEVLVGFYKKHIIPFASYPQSQRPDVEMMMGMFRNHELRLLVTEKTSPVGLRPYEAIGIGCTYAKLLLAKLWAPLPAKELEVLAAYVIFMTKESVEDCGKYTTITTIHGSKIGDTPSGSLLRPPDHSVTSTPWNHIDQWERSFKTTWAQTEKNAIMELIKQDAYGPTPEKFRKRRLNTQ